MKRTKSLRIDVTLKPDALGRRVITIEPVLGDVIYIDTARSTVSNYSNIWVGTDDEVMVNAAYSPVLDVRPAFFRKINIAWDKAEDGKVLSLIIGREASLRLQPPQYMALAQDLVDLAKDSTLRMFRPVLKASMINVSVSANNNILSSSITPSYGPSVLRVQASFNASGVLSIVRTKDTTTVAEQLNSGNALTSNSVYVFDVIVESGELINLQYSVNATLLRLIIVEVPMVVS